MLKKLLVTGFALIVISACGTDNTANTSKADEITHPDLSLAEAVDIFKEAYPGVEIESIDFETKRSLYYDIDGFDEAKEYEVEIDATTKEIREKKVETDRDHNEESLDFSVMIDPKEAIEIASLLKEVAGLSLTGWSLDVDDGIQKYTIN